MMECDINSNGCNPGRVTVCENKSPLFVETGTEIKSEKNRSYFSSDDCPLTLTPESTALREKTLAEQNIIFFLADKLLSWRGNGLQLRQPATPLVPNQRNTAEGGKKENTVHSLRGSNRARFEHPPNVSAVRPERLLPLLVASTCAPSGNCG